MRTFRCHCGSVSFFENTQCVNCQSELGFLSDAGLLSSLKPLERNQWLATENGKTYKKCNNYINQLAGCNWMIEEQDNNSFCLSCRLSEIIPNLGKNENVVRWNRIEQAKRRLVYGLLWLGLPVEDKILNPEQGLSFRLMEDEQHYSEFAGNTTDFGRVYTGHLNGVITLNIEEADPVLSEGIRNQLQERYRTLLGHLRHESGHYYWDRIVKNNPKMLDEFRQLFGDERLDYEACMQGYYNNGPIDNWQSNWVSAYASSHAWEDWAECWAHYLHIVDTMETAYNVDPAPNASSWCNNGTRFDQQYLKQVEIGQLISEWSNLSVLLNEMNRSMGLEDAYPFILSSALIKKMNLIHKVITNFIQ